MSHFALRTVPAIALRGEADSPIRRLNRQVLRWISVLEAAIERNRDRRVLSTMSDRQLADIGIGPSEIDAVVDARHDSGSPRR